MSTQQKDMHHKQLDLEVFQLHFIGISLQYFPKIQ